MKSTLFLFSITLLAYSVNAQYPPILRYCGTTEAGQDLLQKNPDLVPAINKAKQDIEEFTSSYMAQEKNSKMGQVYIIPVVFHILHDYGSENISDEQIFDAMRILNEDFRKKNADSIYTVPAFKSIAADAEIEFRLAQKDPNGNCTKGIDRIYSQETYIGDDGSKLNQWPRNKYLNIWTAKDLSSGAAGYTYLPFSVAGFPSDDGIMIRSDYTGSIGSGSPYTDGALSHEVGHWINLYHPWGSGNNPGTQCGDDNVGDTPETMGWTSCNLSGSVCNPPVIENVQNFMEYSYCETMFTADQAARMRAALNSSTASRNNLWSSSNLLATGTNDGYIPQLCAPVADFFAAAKTTCTGSAIQFNDVSFNGTVTTRTWTFTGGSPSAATDSTPVITYNNPGTFSVTLTVSNSAGSNTKTKSAYITVLPAPLKTIPYSENFEIAAIPGTEWTIINEDNGKTWGLVTTTGYNSSKSLRMNNYGNAAGNIDEIISPTIDMSVISSDATVNFRVAYVQRASSNNDLLRLFVSNDCGKTWVPRWAKTGASLASAPIQSSSFVPSDSSKWTTWSGISIYSSHYVANFRFKFEFTGGGGNYLYIDDINISGTFNKVPVLVFPPNFSAGQPAPDLTLDWNAVSVADTYEVHIDTVYDFSSPALVTAKYAWLSTDNNGTDNEHNLANLQTLRQYFWRVRSKTGLTPSNWSAVWRFTTDTTLGTPENPAGNLTFSVYPNPVEKNSIIVVMVHTKNIFTIDIIDVFGKRIPVAENNELSAGRHIFRLPELNSAGIYFVRIAIEDDVMTRKILIVR
ncbi:MAG: T9SS type A sorting domain-containing protein [Bacteroidetes bacterium]|nr:T9SS type A sorting domain-containing protein [Bacteroidota bacterium]